MKVDKINQLLDGFENFLSSRDNRKNLWIWEFQYHFFNTFNVLEENFLDNYNRALYSNVNRRLWKRSQYFPKEVMLKMIDFDADFIKMMFQDLKNEHRELQGRFQRFIFYCDETLVRYKKANPNSIENNHYHDYAILSIYLMGIYPEKYCIYNYESMKFFLDEVGAKNPPIGDDIERFQKVHKIINTFIGKRPKLIELHEKRLEELKGHFIPTSQLLVFDFLDWVRVRR